MAEAISTEPSRQGMPPTLWLNLPAWAMSVVLHATLLIVLGLTIQLVPRGPVEAPGREVGIVIKHLDESGKDTYESEATTEAPPSETRPQLSTAEALQEVTGRASPVDISQALPKGRDLIGIGSLDRGALPGAADLTRGVRLPSTPTGGKARTQVFGAEAEGTKFVYVFDRSLSMEGSPLHAAKTELIASLKPLGATHRFQIVFYNQDPVAFTIGSKQGLAYGTDANKQEAARFVGGITASGATDHVKALEFALAMQPDAIFFLTDADWVGSEPFPYERIHNRAQGASINCIMFGSGPAMEWNNFLVKLAEQNHGKYAYVDVSRFGR